MNLPDLMKDHVLEFISHRAMATREDLLNFVFEALDGALHDMLAADRLKLTVADEGASHLDEFRLADWH